MSAANGSAALMPEPAEEHAAERAEATRLQAAYAEEFRVFTESSYHVVERVLRAWCFDRELVEDALHEAYLQGRVQWPKIRSYVRPAGWIVTVARNKIINEQRRRQREAARAPEDLPSAPQSGPGDAWEAQDLLRGWLHQLPPRHAEVFQMEREGFSNEEIARILGLADISVRSYKASARSRLRRLAEAAGFVHSDTGRNPGGGHGSR